MRLNHTLYFDKAGDRPLRAWARDADDEDRMVQVEFRVVGNQVRLVPVPDLAAEEIEAVPSGKVAIPPERAVALQGDDFK